MRKLIFYLMVGCLLFSLCLFSYVKLESAQGPLFTVISYPNPFNVPVNLQVTIQFNPSDSLKVMIVNLAGQTVATLKDANVFGTSGYALWDGTDDNGNLVVSGMYFILVRGRLTNQRGKMTVVN